MSSPQSTTQIGVPGGPGFSFSFPPYIIRAIVEMAAILFPEEIPNFLLVSHSVEAWLDPIRYIAVAITPYKKRKPTYWFLKSLPPVFLRDRVRYLCLNDVEYPRGLMRKCSNVTDLSLSPATPAYFEHVEHLKNLQRLSTELGALLGDCERLHQPLFANITHLSMFEERHSSCTWPWEKWQELALLPSLTHLCLEEEITPSLLHGVLANCQTLRIFLNQFRDFERVQPEQYCEAVGVTDVRYVMLETGERVYEWEISARGGHDMWDRAQEFIANKERGAIPKSQFWLYADLWEAELDEYW
ncbi:hypothetical protein FB451DRAFT_1212577 [Mycena latifolia]|nr:hypothetical protein FB451DRAFT_1212577 [Mycena latifolia]